MSKRARGIFEKVPGSGEWWIRYADSTGRIRREKAGNRSAAVNLYRKRKSEVLQGVKLPETLRAKKVSFNDLAKDALEYSKMHKRSYGDDVIRMAKLQESFADRAAESITPQEIERWLSSKTKLKPATLNRYRALLCLTYRLAVQNGKVASNPARLVRQRPENNGRIRFLSAEEEASLRAVVQEDCPHHLPELELAINTGMRMGEQYNLTWDCVDFERRLLTLPRTKNSETRHVPLNDPAIAALRAAQSMGNGQPCLFLNRFGQPLKRPREWFDAAVRKARLSDFTWHCIRHTFASRLVMAGVDLRTVQELMGHKTISMTVRYSHLAPKHQLAAVQRLCNTEDAQKTPTDTRTSTSGSAPVVNGPAAIQ
jgi:site-specific recombinase XerD